MAPSGDDRLMDPAAAAWARQPPIRTPWLRAVPLVCPVGATAFAMPWDGPTEHAHDAATEVLYLAQGSLEIRGGDAVGIHHSGTVLLVPPDLRHDSRRCGAQAAWLFCVVAPNREPHFRRTGFAAQRQDARIRSAAIADPMMTIADEHLSCQRIDIPSGDELRLSSAAGDSVLYLVDGEAAVVMSGEPRRILHRNGYMLQPAGIACMLRALGSAAVRLLCITALSQDPWHS